ncbi:MAG TPA: glycosyltransferase, partial [Candidatus Dojkabacteria bacterium]|nr:glycosyltransferase [Candidatus Dojkabacteria bacterium]
SSIESRKNYPMLIKALSLSNTPLRLKIVGKKADGFDAVIKAINENNMEERVDIMGFLDDAELDNVIKGAMFYTFVSKYEGAGLTPLEAMVKGKAVITSNIEPIREYCGDACYYVDPNDANSIARAINLFYTDTRLRNDFVKKGLEQVKKWSWENTALTTLNIWQKLVNR